MITRVAVEGLLDRASSSAEIGERLGVEPQLADRIVEIHRDAPRFNWLVRRSTLDQRVLLLGDDDGTVVHGDIADATGLSSAQVTTLMGRVLDAYPSVWSRLGRGRYQVATCRCGARDWKVSGLREVTELICGRCRQDLAGTSWPVDPYDRYAVQGA